MDLTVLRQAVESAVRGKLASGESFTTVDISHPLISTNPDVNHRDVKKIIAEIQSRGEISAAGFTTSRITVEPKPGQTAVARLFHHASVDPSSYTTTQQELSRG